MKPKRHIWEEGSMSQISLFRLKELPKLKDKVATPDFGDGEVIEVWHLGDFPGMYFDDGAECKVPCFAIRTAQHRWKWYTATELGILIE